MGFFSALKELFNKNIECDADMTSHIMFFLKKKKYLYLNKNIIVRDGTVCVVAYKSKICDIILPGKYKIDEQSIPETYSRAKIEKMSKKGKKIKKIRVDLYFLSTTEFKKFEFLSDEPFFLKSKNIGRIKGFMKGTCIIRVIDPGLLMKCLLNDTGKEKTEDFNEDVGLWIGNKINKKIEKNKISIENILGNTDYVCSILNAEMEDAFDNIGIFVKNIKLKAIDFPKRYQKKINEYMASHKKVVKPNEIFNRNSNSEQDRQNSYVNVGAMQRTNDVQKTGAYKVCKKCGCRNALSNATCNNCGNRLI